MGFRLDKHIYTNWIEVFLFKISEYILIYQIYSH